MKSRTKWFHRAVDGIERDAVATELWFATGATGASKPWLASRAGYTASGGYSALDYKNDGSYWYTPSTLKTQTKMFKKRHAPRRSGRGGVFGRGHSGADAGAYNPVRYRRSTQRRYKYRKLRWGTKVRKQALGLFEGRRYVKDVVTDTGLGQAIVSRVQLLSEMIHDEIPEIDEGRTTVHDGQIQKKDLILSKKLHGMSVMMRGVKMHFLISNTSTTQKCNVRIICGWRKINYLPGTSIAANAAAIFKNTDTQETNLNLPFTARYVRGATWTAINAPIDKKAFVVAKDMTFHLGTRDANQEQVHGNNTKKLSF